jgi:hypothetical protein
MNRLILVFLLVATLGFSTGRLEKPFWRMPTEEQKSHVYVADIAGPGIDTIYYFDKYSVDKDNRIYTFWDFNGSIVAVIDVGEGWTVSIEPNPYLKKKYFTSVFVDRSYLQSPLFLVLLFLYIKIVSPIEICHPFE